MPTAHSLDSLGHTRPSHSASTLLSHRCLLPLRPGGRPLRPFNTPVNFLLSHLGTSCSAYALYPKSPKPPVAPACRLSLSPASRRLPLSPSQQQRVNTGTRGGRPLRPPRPAPQASRPAPPSLHRPRFPGRVPAQFSASRRRGDSGRRAPPGPSPPLLPP